MKALLAIAALATLAAFGGKKKSPTLSPELDEGPAPRATPADLELVCNLVLTRETDAAIVLEVGALFQRNMLTVTMDGTGRYKVDARPQYFVAGKLPLRDDLILLPEPTLRKGSKGELYNIFQVRAYALRRNILEAGAAGGRVDSSATKTFRQAMMSGDPDLVLVGPNRPWTFEDPEVILLQRSRFRKAAG